MGLYLGNKAKRIFLNGVAYYLHIGPPPKIIEGVQPVTSDGHILTDSNGVYITLKESE